MKRAKTPFITEISESDFRKLDIVAYEQEELHYPGDKFFHFSWKAVKLSKVLDEMVEIYKSGSKKDDLKYPVTIAIHVENGLSADPKNYYFDKNMNAFTGPRTYQIGIGIKHLYSTRDYFENPETNWKVKKSETKGIYRIHLDWKTE